MNWLYWVSAGVVMGLFVYLLAVLLCPEDFS